MYGVSSERVLLNSADSQRLLDMIVVTDNPFQNRVCNFGTLPQIAYRSCVIALIGEISKNDSIVIEIAILLQENDTYI